MGFILLSLSGAMRNKLRFPLRLFNIFKKKQVIMDQLNPLPHAEPKKKGGRPRSGLPYCNICHRLKHKCTHGKQEEQGQTSALEEENKVEEEGR